ncbi:MAG: hypothetical protein K8I60_09005 [Anaerolineae bacterium]|nr:hypothetical protein [Anaerolineae bacterium]
MLNDYSNFLDYKAISRSLRAKFSRSRGLWIHVIVFVAVVTAILGYGTGAGLSRYPEFFGGLTVLGAAWSLILAGHGIISYWRSPARANRREEAVEDAMRQLIQRNPDDIAAHRDDLFTIHQELESGLQRQAFWFLPLTAFTLINAVFWVATLLTLVAFQLTAPLAVFVIGGIGLYSAWRERRNNGQDDWIARLPLPHVGLYILGNFFLGLLAIFRAINMGDQQTIWGWWTLVIIVHILYAVVIQPLTRGVKAKRQPAGVLTPETLQDDKAKRRLTLSDDGELVELPDEEADESVLGL